MYNNEYSRDQAADEPSNFLYEKLLEAFESMIEKVLDRFTYSRFVEMAANSTPTLAPIAALSRCTGSTCMSTTRRRVSSTSYTNYEQNSGKILRPSSLH